ncbi:MAG TPA: hypothetical protein VEX69_02300, partial [Candidatus Limnocylindria bacterium]|nr:hypothetical protein [Candidatus Limnocylindria bacterium]
MAAHQEIRAHIAGTFCLNAYNKGCVLRERMMIRNLAKKLLVVLEVVVCLSVVSIAHAQSTPVPTAAASGPSEASPVYELAKEINLQGTIQKIETVSGPGVLGTHLQL